MSVVLVQYAAPLVCMEARKRARLSQKELERIAGQLMNVDTDMENWKRLKEEHGEWCYLKSLTVLHTVGVQLFFL